ncbi:MAG: hypothetical protein EKK35_23460 [Bradyrhizobiaceae bacterium]|nr:MAG: hypothetical protein EKK35_23460 [Bradyrhizobiaceae bacterium]
MIAQGQDTGRFDGVISTYMPAVGHATCVCSPGLGITVVQALASAELLVKLDVNNDAAWIVDARSLSDSHPELRQLAAFDSADRAAALGRKRTLHGPARRRRRMCGGSGHRHGRNPHLRCSLFKDSPMFNSRRVAGRFAVIRNENEPRAF